MTRRMRWGRSFAVPLGTALVVGCGGAPPPVAPTTAAKGVSAKPAPTFDLSPVPEPAGLLVVGRVANLENAVKTASQWTRLPLPAASDLLNELGDVALSDSVDLKQSIDAAVVLGGSLRSPEPYWAVSVAVRSLEQAKSRLSSNHRITPGPNGQITIHGVGSKKAPVQSREERDEEETDESDDENACVLAPAAGGSGARLVCGETAGLETLVPYLTRTLTRKTFPSDVHVEFRFAPLREPLSQLRTSLPILIRSFVGGSSTALAELLDAGLGEVVDFVDDAQRMTFDTQLGESGARATVRVEYAKATSLIARSVVAMRGREGPAPAAFLHLPEETDLGFYSRGTDPSLFERPRELVGNVLLHAARDAKMPEPEANALRDLVANRLLGLFAGELVYGKGVDEEAILRAIAKQTASSRTDAAAQSEAMRAIAEQVVGFHLVHVEEPITKMTPILKDTAALWNRPALGKWMKAISDTKTLPQVRMTAPPAGTVLPKQTAHLEIAVPLSDVEVWPASGGRNAKPKKVARKPIVLHVLAVPDRGTTWFAIGLDPKLLASKVALSLSDAPERFTLGHAATVTSLRDTKANGAFFVTLRSLFVFAALARNEQKAYAALDSIPNRGKVPLIVSSVAEGPSASAAAAQSVTTIEVPRAAIEDVVRLAIALF